MNTKKKSLKLVCIFLARLPLFIADLSVV